MATTATTTKTADEALIELIRSRGSVTAEEVVRAARPKASPMHSRFEWDDALAGPLWRAEQARSWIRHLTVAIDSPASGPIVTRRVVNVPSDDGDRYMLTAEAVTDPVAWPAVMQAALRDARVFTRKLQSLEALKPGTVGDLVRHLERWISDQ